MTNEIRTNLRNYKKLIIQITSLIFSMSSINDAVGLCRMVAYLIISYTIEIFILVILSFCNWLIELGIIVFHEINFTVNIMPSVFKKSIARSMIYIDKKGCSQFTFFQPQRNCCYKSTNQVHISFI